MRGQEKENLCSVSRGTTIRQQLKGCYLTPGKWQHARFEQTRNETSLKETRKDVYVDRPRRGNWESGATTSLAGFLTTKERNERCQSSPKPKTEHCIWPFPPFLERKEKSLKKKKKLLTWINGQYYPHRKSNYLGTTNSHYVGTRC